MLLYLKIYDGGLEMENYLTVQELAELTGVCVTTVQRWLRSGKVKGIKFGKSWRISKEEVNKIIPADKK